MTRREDIEVRGSTEADGSYCGPAAALIRAAAADNDIAERDEDFLRKKIVTERAALALRDDELMGFGYWSEWEDGRFISHSGLIVRPELRRQGLGRRLKLVLFESSQRRFPEACLMSLTTSPAVRAFNLSLGFQYVPLDQLTSDPAFWKGCETCRNFLETQSRGDRCCCDGMLLRPDLETKKEQR